MPIFQNMTFIHYVQILANVMEIAKFNVHSVWRFAVSNGIWDETELGTPFNPYLTNGFPHHCHLGDSTFMFRGVRSDFQILFNSSMKIL